MARKLRLTAGKLGLFLLLVAVVLFAIGMMRQSSRNDKLSALPKISTETDLRRALQETPRTYILENMVIGGTPCPDALGILKDEYIALSYHEFYYHVRYRQDEPTVPVDFSWILSKEMPVQSESLTLFGNIPLEAADYNPYSRKIPLDASTVKASYVPLLAETYCYYPNGDFREEEGNGRYEVWGIRSGSQVTFLAVVGDGKVTVSTLNKDGVPRISGENTPEALAYTQDESIGSLGLLSFVFFILALLLFFYAILDRPSKKKTRRK